MNRLKVNKQFKEPLPSHQLTSTASSIGAFIEYWGFKSIHGRIWSLIFLSDEPISTPAIVELLKVSKASVSIGVNDLINLNLIQASGKIRNGAVTYISTPNAGAVVRKVLRERELILISQAETNLSLLYSMSDEELKAHNISQKKLKQLLELTQSSKKIVTNLTSDRFNTIINWISYFKKILQLA